jgi:hypothetical protein
MKTYEDTERCSSMRNFEFESETFAVLYTLHMANDPWGRGSGGKAPGQAEQTVELNNRGWFLSHEHRVENLPSHPSVATSHSLVMPWT